MTVPATVAEPHAVTVRAMAEHWTAAGRIGHTDHRAMMDDHVTGSGIENDGARLGGIDGQERKRSNERGENEKLFHK